jgi:quinol monooxygenase YgiN
MVMTVFNVVRFRVKPGHADAFVAAHHGVKGGWPGLVRFNLVDAGDNRFFVIGEWESTEAMAAARPMMIATLDGFRHTLEDLGGGLGLTDPISGTSVLDTR